MKRIFYMLLALCILFTIVACQKDEPLSDEPQEPMETEQSEPILFPGLPVYIETEAHKAKEQSAMENQDGEPQPASPDNPTVFDHFGDPPPDGSIRLVYVYNYEETETLLLENDAEVGKILNIVDDFELSAYDGGPLMGGYMVQIQVVRDGIHQCYSMISGKYDGGYIATNGREAENWYVVSEEHFRVLMDYFGGIPQ